jgi:hypothetical protein
MVQELDPMIRDRPADNGIRLSSYDFASLLTDALRQASNLLAQADIFGGSKTA